METKQNTALVVDDSPSIREYVSTILKNELLFNNVQMACCADEAIDLLDNDTNGEIGWVFSDWEMPGRPTHDLVSYVKEHYDPMDMYFILLTGQDMRDARVLAHNEHVNDYLAKPFTPDVLVNKVRQLMKKQVTRRAKRIVPSIPCEIDISFDNSKNYDANIVDLSETGCLLKTACFNHGQGYVYDIGELTFTLHDGIKIEINSQIVRVERDNDSPESQKNILVAFDFINPKQDVQEPLKKYLEQCELTASHVAGTS